MAMEAVVFPQALFTHTRTRLHPMAGGQWSYELGELEDSGNALLASGCEAAGTGGLGSCHGSAVTVVQEPSWGLFDGVLGLWDPSRSSPMAQSFLQQDYDMAYSSSPEEAPARDGVASPGTAPASAARCRKKRRRAKSCKNEAEVENQRMTHIAVERNRRKQMNEYLLALRSLMPAFYVQRGDQASIVGGAINFVKELEQLLQSLEAQKQMKQQQQQRQQQQPDDATAAAGCGVVLAGVSTATAAAADHNRSTPAAADVDVTMVDSHANLKVLSRRRPRQLLRMVMGLQGLRLTTLHLNVTTIDQMVRYSFSLKVEDDCQLSSVEEIEAAVHQLLGMIQEETDF